MQKELILIKNNDIDEYYARIEALDVVVLCPVASNVSKEVAEEAYQQMITQGFKAYSVKVNHFVDFLKNNYGIEVHDFILEDYNKHQN